MTKKDDRSTGTRATLLAAQTHRRQALKVALGGTAALAAGLHAPAVLSQAKPFQGVDT